MSSTLKQAIQALKARVADAYTAIVAKGGTLPATQDSANLPTAIASIPSGGAIGYYYNFEDYGVSSNDAALINDFWDEKLQESLPFGTIKNVPFVIYSGDIGHASVSSQNNIETFFLTSGNFAGYQTFYGCLQLEYLVLGESTTANFNIHGGSACFYGCGNLRAIIGKPLVFPSDMANDHSNMFSYANNVEYVMIDYRSSLSWNISNLTRLQYGCLLYLLNHLTEVTNSPTFTIGSTNIAKLNATTEGQAAIAAAQAKGWTIS